MNRKSLLMAFAFAASVLLGACSSSTPPVVAISGAPASLEVNLTSSLTATVTHDSSNGGVTWSCAPAGACGTFSPSQTASGTATTYTAPATAGSVTITATSVKKATSTATATINVTAVASASNLSGQYAFKVSGWDASGTFYGAAGSVTLDGAGNVTGGEEDFNDTTVGTASVADGVTGTYTVGADGQGTMVLNAVINGTSTADTNVGVAGVQTLAFTVVNNNHFLISEFDSAFTSGGVMDLQTASAFTTGLTGNYAFTGYGFLNGAAISYGGAIVSSGTSLSGPADSDETGLVASGTTSGAVTAADANGRGTAAFGSLNVAYYTVGTEVAYFVETDPTLVTVGAFYGQGSAPSFSAASLSGNFVMSQPDADSGMGLSSIAGQFAADGTASIAGVVDYNEGGLIALEPVPDALNASYTVAASGYGAITGGVVTNDVDFATWGVYLTDPALNLSDPNSTSGGGGALINEIDVDALGTGVVLPQSSTSAEAGNLAFNLNGYSYTAALPGNIVGQVVSDGSASLAGTASFNTITAQTPGQAISATIAADSTNAGRYQLAVTSGTSNPNLVFYQASSGVAVQIDVDSSSTLVQIGTGVIEGQQ
jgi:hypothetical protein